MGRGWEQQERWGGAADRIPSPLGRQKAGAGAEAEAGIWFGPLGLTSTSPPRLTTPPPLPGEAPEGPFRAALGLVCTHSQLYGAVHASKHQFLRQNTESCLEACGQFVPVFSIRKPHPPPQKDGAWTQEALVGWSPRFESSLRGSLSFLRPSTASSVPQALGPDPFVGLSVPICNLEPELCPQPATLGRWDRRGKSAGRAEERVQGGIMGHWGRESGGWGFLQAVRG